MSESSQENDTKFLKALVGLLNCFPKNKQCDVFREVNKFIKSPQTEDSVDVLIKNVIGLSESKEHDDIIKMIKNIVISPSESEGDDVFPTSKTPPDEVKKLTKNTTKK